MRRKDQEVQDRQEIFDILRRCDTVRIGIQGEKYPLERCAGMARLMVGKIVLEEITVMHGSIHLFTVIMDLILKLERTFLQITTARSWMWQR